MSDEEKHYYLRHAKHQKFYIVLAKWMTWVSIGEQEWWGYDKPRFPKLFWLHGRLLVPAVSVCMLASQSIYLYTNFSVLPFEVKGTMFAIVPHTAYLNLCLVGSHLSKFEEAMKKFMNKIHLCNVPNQSEFVQQERIIIEKVIRFCCYFLIFLLMIDWLAWALVTVYFSYQNKPYISDRSRRLETVVYAIVPFDFEYDWNSWVLIHSWNLYLLWVGISIIVSHNSLLFALVLQVIGHIDILKHRLKTDFVGDFDQNEIRRKLIDIIQYHALVVDVLADVQNAFGFSILSYYAYNMIADSVILYQVMAGGDAKSKMVYGPMILAYMGGLIVMSFILEEIRRRSDDFAHLMYDIDWATYSIQNKKMLGLLLMRMQPALVFTASGGLEAGVRPMINIYKSTFSYYLMLKQSI